MNLNEAQIQKISAATMERLGDVVRCTASVNVAQRIKSLGLKPEDLPEGKMAEAHEAEMGVQLGRLVENTARCMIEMLDAMSDKPPPPKKKPRAKR